MVHETKLFSVTLAIAASCCAFAFGITPGHQASRTEERYTALPLQQLRQALGRSGSGFWVFANGTHVQM